MSCQKTPSYASFSETDHVGATREGALGTQTHHVTFLPSKKSFFSAWDTSPHATSPY